MSRVCSWIYFAKLSDIFLFGIIKYSPIDQRTESSVYLPLISFWRYVIYGWIIISVEHCVHRKDRIRLISYIIKQRTSAWNACINKIWTFVYITTRFCCFMRYFLWVYLILLWFCALCAFDRYITTAFWRRFTFCILAFVVFAHWIMYQVFRLHIICFSRLSRLFGYYRRFMRKYQLHILYNLAYSFLLFLIAAAFGENFMMIAALFTAKK